MLTLNGWHLWLTTLRLPTNGTLDSYSIMLVKISDEATVSLEHVRVVEDADRNDKKWVTSIVVQVGKKPCVVLSTWPVSEVEAALSEATKQPYIGGSGQSITLMQTSEDPSWIRTT